MGRKIRIGIDVGGTFTDAVAMDNEKYEIIGLKKIHTTHFAKEGVTAGVITILKELLHEINADSEDVVFIAHGTTQATNALLEGDVSPVGVIGIGSGLSGAKTKMDTDLGKVALADGKSIDTKYNYVSVSNNFKSDIDKIIKELKNDGFKVVVASEAFSVDNPENEETVSSIASENNFLCTCTHDISKLYGLKARTKTAIINASILPKMIQTAEMTSEAVVKADIKAPLMIMRSDGGVMHVNEIKKRPILTVLSGPAAGVAGALMYEQISDGIFLEVGGTSTDISAIHNGKVMTKYAQIGGNSTYVTSLDINTIGIAGGSMVYASSEKIMDVGPRSAHIAGLPYACFADSEQLKGSCVNLRKPTDEDKNTAITIVSPSGKEYAVTLTCAANYYGLVPEGDYAHAEKSSVEIVFNLLAGFFNDDPMRIAENILTKAIEKVAPAVLAFIKEYDLNKHFIYLCGGGGGASAVVPFLAKYLGMKFKIVKNAPYISTIGAALAMVRDTVERTIINPTEDDILKIREEAIQAVLKAGASAETVSVEIEIDSTKNIVKAVAVGTTDVNSGKDLGTKLSPEEIIKRLSEKYECKETDLVNLYSNNYFTCVEVALTEKKFFGLVKSTKKFLNVVDVYGIVKLNLQNTVVYELENDKSVDRITEIIDANSKYDESGKVIPDIYVILGGKLLNLDGLISAEQAVAVISTELNSYNGEKIGIIIRRK